MGDFFFWSTLMLIIPGIGFGAWFAFRPSQSKTEANPGTEPEPTPKPEPMTKPENKRQIYTASTAPEWINFQKAKRLIPKQVLTQTGNVANLTVPRSSTNDVDFDRWAKNIANNVYLRCQSSAMGQITDYLEPIHFDQPVIEDPDSLKQAAWLQCIVHPETLAFIGSNHAKKAADLERMLLTRLRKLAKTFLAVHLNIEYKPIFQICSDPAVSQAKYTLRTLYLPQENDKTCKALLEMNISGAEVIHPVRASGRIRLGSESFSSSITLPLSPIGLEEVSIGNQEWNHSIVPLGDFQITLKKLPPEQGEVARYTVVSKSGKSKVHLEKPGAKTYELQSGDIFGIVKTEGAKTQFNLAISTDENQTLKIGTFRFLNPLPKVENLPGIANFRDLTTSLETADDVAQFLVSRLYMKARFGDLNHLPHILEEPIGAETREDGTTYYGNAIGMDDKPFPLTKDQQPPGRIQMEVDSQFYQHLEACFGGVRLYSSLRKAVLNCIQKPKYRTAFMSHLDKLTPQEGSPNPGVQVDLTRNKMLPPDSCLIHTSAALDLNAANRSIYGVLRLDAWEDALDLSGTSTDPKNTAFFYDFPTDCIARQLSNYALYDVKAPEVGGLLTFMIKEVGNGFALNVQNRTFHDFSYQKMMEGVMVDEGVLLNGEDQNFSLQPQKELQLHLYLNERRLTAIIWPEPRPQSDVPHFIPSPAKLDFYGQTLANRGLNLSHTAFSEWRSNLSLQNLDVEVEGGLSLSEDCFLATVNRNGLAREIHCVPIEGSVTFANQDTSDDAIKALGRPLGNFETLTIETAKQTEERRNFYKVDLSGMRRDIENGSLLLDDYFYDFALEIEALLHNEVTIMEIELWRKHPNENDKASHLYLVSEETYENRKRFWLFSPKGAMHEVRLMQDSLSSQPISGSEKIIGPFDADQEYRLAWPHSDTWVTIFPRIPNHQEQFENYLANGFLQVPATSTYVSQSEPGFVVKQRQPHEPHFITNETMRIKGKSGGIMNGLSLDYNPREYADFFDSQSYAIRYEPKLRRFVVEAKAHGKKRRLTPKTVFMLVPKSGRPILGSHALPYVVIPDSKCYLVFPGVTLYFTQGREYYLRDDMAGQE